ALRLAIDVCIAPLRVEREEALSDALEDLHRVQVAFRGHALGDVHPCREYEEHATRVVLDRHTCEVGDTLGAVAQEINRDAAERLPANRALDRILDPRLNLGGSIPPAAFPEGFADDLRGRVAALLERGPVG